MTDKILGSVLCRHCNKLHRSYIPCGCDETTKELLAYYKNILKDIKNDKNNTD